MMNQVIIYLNYPHTNYEVGGDSMAKKGQRATWENDHFQAPKKNDVPPVPAISNQKKHD